jgi:hypothetical protein
MSYSADGALKFCGVHRSNLAIVVEIVKRLVNAGKLLTIGKYQQLVFAETFGLIHCELLCAGGRNAQQGHKGQRKKSGERTKHVLKSSSRVLRSQADFWMG